MSSLYSRVVSCGRGILDAAVIKITNEVLKQAQNRRMAPRRMSRSIQYLEKIRLRRDEGSCDTKQGGMLRCLLPSLSMRARVLDPLVVSCSSL